MYNTEGIEEHKLMNERKKKKKKKKRKSTMHLSPTYPVSILGSQRPGNRNEPLECGSCCILILVKITEKMIITKSTQYPTIMTMYKYAIFKPDPNKT